MKHIKSFLILTAILTGGFLSHAAGQTYGGGKTETQKLERKVFKKLLRLPYYGVFDLINYQIDGDTVTLSGRVAEARNKKDAENAIENIEGVKRVVNNIEILPLSPFDNSIRYRLLKTYAARGGGIFRYLQEPNPSVRLIVEGGHLTLEGVVANRGDYNLLNVLAHGVSDIFSVKNNLIIEKELINK
jgi:hyperosmotically inducible periplasmic protein